MLMLERRIELGKLTRSCFDLATENLTDEERRHVYQLFYTLMREETAPESNEIMSYVEAQKWYREKECPFKPYVGKKIIDVDPQYLLWLDEQPDFRRELHRFLTSEYWRITHGKS